MLPLNGSPHMNATAETGPATHWVRLTENVNYSPVLVKQNPVLLCSGFLTTFPVSLSLKSLHGHAYLKSKAIVVFNAKVWYFIFECTITQNIEY